MVISLNLDDSYRSSKLQGATKAESAASSEKKEEKEKKKEEDNE
jgi:hypothetical protein